MLGPIGAVMFECLLPFMLFSFSVFVLAFAGLLRVAPTLAPYLGRSLWRFLEISREAYAFTLKPIATRIEARWQIDILSRRMRFITTTVFSLLVGIALSMLLQVRINSCLVLGFALHGFAVAKVWDDVYDDNPLRVGDKI